MKVVRLLQDMQAELEHEVADDKAVHEKLGCWCQENEQEKSKAIATNEAKEAELESFLAEAAARMKEKQAKRDESLDEVNRNFDALQKAQALRMKEAKAFQDEEVDLQGASQACSQALVVLKEYHASPSDLAQVRTVAQRLQQAQVLDLAKRSANAPEDSQLKVLQSFLVQSQTPSFLSVPAGGRYASYAPQSGEIYGILDQMREEFDGDLEEARKKEKQAIAQFLELKTAKEAEIQAGRTLVAKLDGEIADLKVRHAEAFEELENTQAQLALDRTFLANLKKKCSESEAEFEARVKDRMEEIAAVADTINILNTDAAFETFGDTAFLQMSSMTAVQNTQDKQQRLRKVSSILQKAAIGLSSPELSLLAASAQNDAFAKVKEMIDKMIVQLTTQQSDESKHRDWCIKEMHSNERSTAEASDKRDSLETRTGDLERSIEYLKKEIEATTAAVAEMQVEMKRASETREGENAAFQETVNDQRMTQIILQKAIARMQEVYSFVQDDADQPGAPHIQTSGTHTDPGNGPARFNSYEKSAAGGRVVALLQQVHKDSKKMENDAMAGDLDAQSAYEIFMQDSNKAIAAYNKKVVDMKGAIATSKEELGLANSDLKATLHELKNLHAELGDLKESCDFIIKTFDDRQAARSDEIDALKQAKAILSGAN